MKLLLTLLAALLVTASLRADDWPQWMGPKRDNVWREEGILEKFPAGGPKKLWSTPLAGGYAGPAVAGEFVYVTDYVKKTGETDEGNFDLKETTGIERVFCLDAGTGKQVWKHEYPVKYAISYPYGPRATPLVDANMVYILGAVGDLIAFNAKDGKVVWSKNLMAEYKTKSAIWGYAAHPMIDGKKLITLAGGEGSHVVAFDKATGKELWKSQTQQQQGYSPPTIIEAGGKRQLIVCGPTAIRSLDPETGERYWSEKYEATMGSVIMTPVVFKEYLYFGGYQAKNILLKLDKDKPAATTEWRDQPKAGIAAVNVQPFLQDGVLYGFDDNGTMYAVELPSGKRLWESKALVGDAKGSETAFLVKNGDRFICFTERGDLVLCKFTKEKYEEIDRAKGIMKQTNTAFGRPVVWCAPAFAHKKMFVRNDKEIACFDLAK
jgi:outer membrane protein assembly factor BamB